MQTFNQSCLDNHQCYRVLLQAMSRPGKIFTLADAPIQREQALLRLIDTVLDQQVSFGLFDASPELEGQLQLLTGSRTAPLEGADFLLAPSGSSHGQLRTAKRGRLEFPDEGATVVFAVETLSEGNATTGLPLTGPGIKETIHPQIDGLDQRDLDALKEINSDYPLGIDCIFVDRAGQLLCIPRSTRIGGNG